jgi:hypothetical protein
MLALECVPTRHTGQPWSVDTRPMRVIAALFLALLAAVLAPASAAVACSPHVPTFDYVMKTDSTIVIGRLGARTEGDRTRDTPPRVTIDVTRVLRGTASETVAADDWTTACRDELPVTHRRVIVALDVPFGDDEYTVYWTWGRGSMHSVAEENPRVGSLNELANRIAALPDTATDSEAGPWHTRAALMLAPLGLLVLGYLVAKPITRRRRV